MKNYYVYHAGTIEPGKEAVSHHFNNRMRMYMADEADARINELEKALAFYAYGGNYCQVLVMDASKDDPRTFAPVLQDDGKQARAALGWTSPYPENTSLMERKT